MALPPPTLAMTTKLRRQIFLIGLVLGLICGFLAFALGQYVFKFNDYFGNSDFAMPVWYFAKYVIVIGMAFGVGFSSLTWYIVGQDFDPEKIMQQRKASPYQLKAKIKAFWKVFLWIENTLAHSILCTAIAFIVLVIFFAIFNRVGDTSTLFWSAVLTLMGTVIYAGMTQFPIAFLMYPLITKVWEAWFAAQLKKQMNQSAHPSVQ